jgi:hypothetical protein
MSTTSESDHGELTGPDRLAREDDKRRRGRLVGGGPDGNEQLTATLGVILLVLLAVLGVTILRIGQLISLHLFLGLLLLGPVAAKIASTGYRFVRYYTHQDAYRRKGPPEPVMRLIGPLVVISTVIVFASGVVLLFYGPSRRGSWVEIHKVSFIVWLVFMGLHVLGHLQHLPASVRAARSQPDLAGPALGSAGRWITIAGALVAGAVLAIVLIPHFAAWTTPGAFAHHRH